MTASGETTTFAWNASGQLSHIASTDATVTYEYGVGGMRSRKTIEFAGATSVATAFYAGSQLTAERDSDGTLYRYLYGPGGAPLEVVVTTGTVTARYALHTDALGSVVALSDATGVTVATYAYDPWGAPLETRMLAGSALDQRVAARQPFRYRGYTLDAETGLYYLPARYYDPHAARFLSPDPVPPSAGDPASLNPYVYCQDDPIGASDPSGAIMTLDDDGRVDAYEASAYAATRAKSKKMRDYFMGQARSQYSKWLAQRKAAAAAVAAAKAAAAERAARMAMAQARLDTSLAMKEAIKEGYADVLEDVQSAAGWVGLAAGVAILCTPVGWAGAAAFVAGASFVAGATAVVGLAVGAGRVKLGDDDYGWENLAFDATVTVVTAGVGGSVAKNASVGVQKVSGVAWTSAEAAIAACNR